MNRMTRPIGWRNESYRHYLASKGIRSKMNYFSPTIKGEESDKDRVVSKIDNVVFFRKDGEIYVVNEEELGKKSATGSLAPHMVLKAYADEDGDGVYLVVGEKKNGKLDGIGVSRDIIESGHSNRDMERGKLLSPEEGVELAKKLYEGVEK